jgi:hypothetical protein
VGKVHSVFFNQGRVKLISEDQVKESPELISVGAIFHSDKDVGSMKCISCALTVGARLKTRFSDPEPV